MPSAIVVMANMPLALPMIWLEMESSLQIQAIFAITSLQAILAIITLGIRREITKHIEVNRQGVTLIEAIVTR